jgi:hypothetical protein
MKKRKTKDEFNFLVDFYWKNQDCRPKDIVKKAQEIDLLRNRFGNMVIYNYFLYFKRYLKDGYFCKGVQKFLKEAFEEKIKRVHKECVQPIRKVSFEEGIIQINNRIEKDLADTREKCMNILKTNKEKIKELTRINDEVEEFLECREEELENMRHNMIQELLHNI